MNPPPSPLGLTCQLTLADGRIWEIAAADRSASRMVGTLSEIFQLPAVQRRDLPPPPPADQAGPPAIRQVLLDQLVPFSRLTADALCANPVILPCGPDPARPGMELFSTLQQITALVSRDAEERGGLLLHGALALWQGQGVLLAAPGGTGKTTASQRLPPPWRSVCDDATLVLPVGKGQYRAHPWPTLSHFVLDREGGSWDVQRAVWLRLICFLQQAPHEQAEPVGAGQATTLLLQAVRQASWGTAPPVDQAEQRRLNLRLLDNASALARAVPTCLLQLSLTGAFWQELEPLLAA